jgi:hypothetical protein
MKWRRGKSQGDSRSPPTREARAARAKDAEALKLKPFVGATVAAKQELLREETAVKPRTAPPKSRSCSSREPRRALPVAFWSTR